MFLWESHGLIISCTCYTCTSDYNKLVFGRLLEQILESELVSLSVDPFPKLNLKRIKCVWKFLKMSYVAGKWKNSITVRCVYMHNFYSVVC